MCMFQMYNKLYVKDAQLSFSFSYDQSAKVKKNVSKWKSEKKKKECQFAMWKTKGKYSTYC